MEKRFVYADNAATTPVAPEILDKMLPWLTKGYGNPSTLYSLGREAAQALKTARQQVAGVLNAQTEEIFFVGSGTEADNMVLRGLMHSGQAKGKTGLITSTVEHPAVLQTAAALEKEGFKITYLPVDSTGLVHVENLDRAIDENTALVSVMTANNEIGTIQPISQIGELCRRRGVFFHTDAVQAFGHIPIDVHKMNIDFLSLSGHKINAPKGIGGLFVRAGLKLTPVITGGGQERNRRSGTENVAGIAALGEAAQWCAQHMDEEAARLTAMRDKLIKGVLSAIPQSSLTGHPENRLPGSGSFIFAAVEGEGLVLMLDMAGICSSTGSACSTGSLDPSHVLMAIGLAHEAAHGSLRLTLGRQNTMEDVDYILAELPKIVSRLRAMSPVWHE